MTGTLKQTSSQVWLLWLTSLILMVRLNISCSTSGLRTFWDLKMTWLNLICWGKLCFTHSTLFLSLEPDTRIRMSYTELSTSMSRMLRICYASNLMP